MKLTEQHQKAIAKRIEGYDRSMHCAHDSRELSEHFESGAEWGIEQFGGIQWNKYPEVKPPRNLYTRVLIVNSDGVWKEGMVRDGRLFLWNSSAGVWVRTHATHWAEINLPNK